MSTHRDFPAKHCIIGAGPAGLPIAKKLMELGEDFEVLEKNAGVGGLWYEQAHDTVTMLSSRYISQYTDFAMAGHYPLFLDKPHAQHYLKQYADQFGITEHIQFSTEVVNVKPADDYAQTRHWQVTLATGEKRLYKTVTLATGLYSKPKPLNYPGQFTGELLYSNQYQNPRQLQGKRVLVVGNGNSACDITADASNVNPSVDISMYRGVYVFPKHLLGFPLIDLITHVPTQALWLKQLISHVAICLHVGNLKPYGMLPPHHHIFERHPVFNQAFIDQLKAGKIHIKPDIERFNGQEVFFKDGSSAECDSIVSAIGYQVSYPMLEPGLLDWQDSMPVLYYRSIAPKFRGLFIAGLGQVHTGGWPFFEFAGYLLARCLAFEGASPTGVIDTLAQLPYIKFAQRFWHYQPIQPATLKSYSPGEVYRELEIAQQTLDAAGFPAAPSRRGRTVLKTPLQAV